MMRWPRRTRWTRWTRRQFTAALTLALLACGKSAARKAAEVRECSAITMDAKGAAQCLVLQHNWKRSEEHTSELQSQSNLVCRLLLEKKKTNGITTSMLSVLTGIDMSLV